METGNTEEMPDFLEDLYVRSTESMTNWEEQQVVRDILTQYEDVFVSPQGKMGRTTAGKHVIARHRHEPASETEAI